MAPPTRTQKSHQTHMVLRGFLPVPCSRQEQGSQLASLRPCRWPSRRTVGSGASARCPHPPCCHLRAGGRDAQIPARGAQLPCI